MGDFNQRVSELIKKRDFAAAELLLEESLRAMPAHWKPVQDFPDQQTVACWDMAEFLSLVAYYDLKGFKKRTVWIPPSYSRAYYMLAHVRVERGQMEKALEALNRGLEVEGDHPQLLSEKAFILQKLKRPAEAFALFQKAATARPWTPNPVKARALRGAGVSLVDLGRLDEAETLLKESLALEPKNSLALSELAYIAGLRAKNPN